MLDLQQTFKYRIEKRHGKYKLEMVFWQMLLFFCVDIVPKIFVLLSASHNDNDDDDYKFVYVGPEKSWTPFHSDVFGSFSWSANIVGTKRWIFVHPGESV